jgi:hypothetical protein
MRDRSSLALKGDAVLLEAGEYWADAAPTERKPLVHEVAGVTISAADTGMSVRRAKDVVVVYVARGMATVNAPGGRVEVQAGEQVEVRGKAEPKAAAVAFWEDWTGGMADLAAGKGLIGAGAGTIYGVDSGAPAGSQAGKLSISKQVVQAVVRGGLSETRVDQTFFNPGQRDVEGWYWFTVPEDATVTGFAVETDGVLVDGEFIEKKQARAQYSEAKHSGHSPAILEYVDGNTYRARIFPVPAGTTRRVVLRYLELRTLVDGTLEYIYPMGAGDPVRIGEFSLSVDLGDDGLQMKLSTLEDARVEDGGRRVTMRRSGYTPRAPFQLEARLLKPRPPFTVARYSAGGDSADYLLARYAPDVDWEGIEQQRGDVVLVVDTSAAGDEASRRLKNATAEAILRALSDSDRFALVSLDVKPTVLHPKKGLAPAADKQISTALEALAEHSSGGATDMAALFDVSLSRLHSAEQPAVIYVGDGIATSGEMTGEQLAERLRRALATSRTRLFTVGVGNDADHALLGELARSGGGEGFRVEQAEETTARALEIAAALKVPTITDLEIDLGAGLDEAFMSANRKVSKGSEVTVLARTHHGLPARVKVKGRLAGKPFEREYPARRDQGIINALVPKLWASAYVQRLLGAAAGPDAERGRIVSLGVEYGLMTPFTSILALESEAAYATMGIQRNRSPLRGVKLTALSPLLERRLGATWAVNPAQAVMGCSKAESESSLPAEVAAPQVAQKSQALIEEQKPSYAPAAATAAVPEAPATEPVREDEALTDEAEAVETTSSIEVDDVAQAADKGGAAKPAAARSRERRALAARRPVRAAKQTAAARGFKRAPALAKPDPNQRAEEPAEEGSRDSQAATQQSALATCSDASERPLAQRVLLWRQRLRQADNAGQLRERYLSAMRACELSDWRAERTFLSLLQDKVRSEAGARLILEMFAARPEVQKHVAKLILRRSVDAAIVRAVEGVVFGSAVNWNLVDLELQAAETPPERIAILRRAMLESPEDPNGGIRLVSALVDAGDKDQAVAIGRRLRDQGLLTPAIARQLGDALAAAGLSQEAVRTYSEIVEFDAESTQSRRLLGDIYLGHGWFTPAYRQYRTLTELAPDDALAWLRLASAAAGEGRIDEALRLERKVASGQGTPGPSDPRRWARLQSAARLAELLHNPGGEPGKGASQTSVKRKLKELQLFSGPGVLAILSWRRLDSDLVLDSLSDGAAEARGEFTDASKAGLSARLLSLSDDRQTQLAARLRSAPQTQPLPLILYRLTWDGKDFEVKVAKTNLSAQQTKVEL